tara:strand:+ start:330 stop:584 length:255 start_codon:yes stop_codon:yes gene_type:complete
VLNKIKNIFKKQKQLDKSTPDVRVIKVHLDQNDPANGFFELEWNHLFVHELKKNGYTGANDEEIVNAWFSELCYNIYQDDQDSL